MANVINQNSNMSPQTLILLDGSLYDPKTGLVNSKLNDGVLKTLGENGTIVIAIQQYSWTSQDGEYERWAKDFNVNVIKCKDLSLTNHDGVNKDYIENSWFRFQLGTGTFPEVHNEWIGSNPKNIKAIPGAYTAEIFYKSTGKWTPTDFTGMTLKQVSSFIGFESTIFNLQNLNFISMSDSNTVSDSDILNAYLNNIIGKIKNSSFVSQNNYMFAFQSTTNVPSKIPTIIMDFCNANANLLKKIADDVYQFAKIGESKDILDKNIAQQAEYVGSNFQNQDGISGDVNSEENN